MLPRFPKKRSGDIFVDLLFRPNICVKEVHVLDDKPRANRNTSQNN